MLNSLVHIFKLTCIGTIHFKRNGKDFNERISENFLRSSNPSDIKNFTVATLIPNTFYSCHLQTVSGSRSSLPYSEIQFATPPGRPSPPPKPKIINYKDKFVVQLYKSNVKYGSIRYMYNDNHYLYGIHVTCMITVVMKFTPFQYFIRQIHLLVLG
jgi:hypothetical protein